MPRRRAPWRVLPSSALVNSSMLCRRTLRRPVTSTPSTLWPTTSSSRPCLLLLVGGWVIRRTIVRLRVDAYVQRLREEPGIVVANAELRNGKWQISGLRDPLAADPASLLSQSGLNAKRVAFHWESYQALNPAIVMRRLAASLNPPPSVSLSLKGDTVEVTGSVPQYWVERARTLVAALPAGSPNVDLSSLTRRSGSGIYSPAQCYPGAYYCISIPMQTGPRGAKTPRWMLSQTNSAN